jgi:3-(3-hydroxy-phenyl)propionate hydroxylase
MGVRDGNFDMNGVTHIEYRSPVFGRLARIATTATFDGHPRLVTLHRPELERLLRRRLRDLSRADVRFATELLAFSDDGRAVHARVRDAGGRDIAVRASYLIGADGADSMVRRELGLLVNVRPSHADLPIVDVPEAQPPTDHVAVECGPGRPRARHVLQPPLVRVCGRAARRLSQGRCFLVGDAARVAPSGSSQGLAGGLRDASNLAWKLSAVVRKRMSSNLLDSYDVERRPQSSKRTVAARIVGALARPRHRVARLFMHGAVALARQARVCREFLDDLSVAPANTLAHGFFVRQGRQDRLRAGAIFPQGWIRTPSMPESRLSDEAIGDDWSLIAFRDDPHAWMTPALALRWEAAGGRIWQWCHRNQSQHLGPPGRRIESLDDAVLPGRVSAGWAVIVRPDRHVFAEGPVAEIDAIARLALDRMGVQQGRADDESILDAA